MVRCPERERAGADKQARPNGPSMVDMYVHLSCSVSSALRRLQTNTVIRKHTNAQTGVSDIPLTANGERMVKEMAPRMVGEKSMPTTSILNILNSKLIPDLIHPDQIRHILVSPRQRAQKTAALVRPINTL
jgi:hypothetical protein